MARYGVKTVVDGITFHSKLEAARYIYLSQLEEEGVIRDLRLQVVFVLQERFVSKQGNTIRPMTYAADFVYNYEGLTYIEDTKGYKEEVYKLKKKLLLKKLLDTDYFFYEVYEPDLHPRDHRREDRKTRQRKKADRG